MGYPQTQTEESQWQTEFPPQVMDNGVRRFYLPIHDESGDNQWVNEVTGEHPSYTNWDLAEPNGGHAENCSVLNIAEDRTYWADWPCDTFLGFICNVLGQSIS